MRRDFSAILVWLYGAALLLMAATVVALLLGRMQVSGLTTAQAVGITLAVMVLIGLRLFAYIRTRRTRAATPPPTGNQL